jgi:hypothetical protein
MMMKNDITSSKRAKLYIIKWGKRVRDLEAGNVVFLYLKELCLNFLNRHRELEKNTKMSSSVHLSNTGSISDATDLFRYIEHFLRDVNQVIRATFCKLSVHYCYVQIWYKTWIWPACHDTVHIQNGVRRVSYTADCPLPISFAIMASPVIGSFGYYWGSTACSEKITLILHFTNYYHYCPCCKVTLFLLRKTISKSMFVCVIQLQARILGPET